MSAIKVNVSKDFVEMNIADKLEFGDAVIAALIVALVLFPNLLVPPTGLVSLTSLNDDLRAKLTAYNANPGLHAALENSETNWIAAFEKDANYVNGIASGNAATIAASGYNATKDIRVKAAQPATTVVKTANSVVTGGLDVEMIPQKDADSFVGITYTNDLTPVFHGNQVTFTFVNNSTPVPTTSQIAVVISKNRKFSFSGLLSLVKQKLVTLASNAWGLSHPSAPADKGIL